MGAFGNCLKQKLSPFSKKRRKDAALGPLRVGGGYVSMKAELEKN
jgi:hypothetical protein